ncbi:hypothetical protein IQ265_05695 [Nodosilinea sp. LEGE 06152]|nr:hypothetical protein [Nodosilinea sp. LEGE 06152]
MRLAHTLLAGVDLSQFSASLFTGGNPFAPLPLNIFNPVYNAFPRNPAPQIPLVNEFYSHPHPGALSARSGAVWRGADPWWQVSATT